MKKLLMKALLFIISILLLNSCQTPISERIIGKWKVKEVSIDNYNDAYLEYKKVNDTNISFESFEDLIISNFDNFYFDFNDSTVNLNNKQSAEWTATNNEIIIKTTTSYKFSIVELFDNEMIADFYFSYNNSNIVLKMILDRE